MHGDISSCGEAPVSHRHVERVVAHIERSQGDDFTIGAGHWEDCTALIRGGGGRGGEAVGESVVDVLVSGVDLTQDAAGVFITGGGHEDVQRKDCRREDALLNYAHAYEGARNELRFAAVWHLNVMKEKETHALKNCCALRGFICRHDFFPTAEGNQVLSLITQSWQHPHTEGAFETKANKSVYRSCFLTFTLSHRWSSALQEKKQPNSDSNLSVHLVCNKTSHLHFISHLPTRFFFSSVLSSVVTHQHPATHVMTPTQCKCLWFMILLRDALWCLFQFSTSHTVVLEGGKLFLDYIYADTNID